MFLTSVRHGLAGLLRFSGRDAPGRFWPYAFTLFLLTMGAMSIWMTRIMATFQRYAVAHPDRATVMHGTGGMRISVQGNPPELAPAMQDMVIGVGVIAAIFVLMMAGAVVRRLHDRDRTGWWGALPVALLALGILGMSRLFGETGPADLHLGMSLLIFANNLAYLASLFYLIVVLAGPGTPGPNEFGPAHQPD